jgi:hypothetical protein
MVLGKTSGYPTSGATGTGGMAISNLSDNGSYHIWWS